MKSKIISLAAIAVITAGGYLGYRAQLSNGDQLSDLMKANIEALARDETSGSSKTRVKCYTSIHYELGSKVVECTSCKSLEDYTDDLFNFHDYCWSWSN